MNRTSKETDQAKIDLINTMRKKLAETMKSLFGEYDIIGDTYVFEKKHSYMSKILGYNNSHISRLLRPPSLKNPRQQLGKKAYENAIRVVEAIIKRDTKYKAEIKIQNTQFNNKIEKLGNQIALLENNLQSEIQSKTQLQSNIEELNFKVGAMKKDIGLKNKEINILKKQRFLQSFSIDWAKLEEATKFLAALCVLGIIVGIGFMITVYYRHEIQETVDSVRTNIEILQNIDLEKERLIISKDGISKEIIPIDSLQRQ